MTANPIRWGIVAASAAILAGCGALPHPPSAAPVQTAVRKPERVTVPVIQWHAVSVGPEVLLNEGTSISSVLPGPGGRIYYGTSNPLGDSSTIGWYSPESRRNIWTAVPATRDFPPQAGISAQSLNLSQSSYWGAVNLVVSGTHTVWYRHWGYVGGWTASSRFVPGDYAIPGPTVHRSNYTASVYTSFQGAQMVRLMNIRTRQMQSFALPETEDPVAIAFGSSHNLWLLTADTLWSLNTAQALWTPAATAPGGDFFVAMGNLPRSLWIVDANGNVGFISGTDTVHWTAHLHLNPLAAQPAGPSGLWIASLHHLSLWLPGHPLRQWPWPSLAYPSPASRWPRHGAGAPPDWPPMPHLATGPHGALDMGYGTFIGQAALSTRLARSVVGSSQNGKKA